MEADNTQRKAAFAFGVVFVIVMLILAIGFPNPSRFQYEVFKVVLAIAVAGVAAMIPGFLDVNIGTAIRAGGAIAVFVLIYFYSPAGLVATPTPLKEHAGFLSTLQNHFQKRVPSSEYSLKVDPGPNVDVGGFWIEETTDEQWEGLFQKICSRNGACMKCTVGPKNADIEFTRVLIEKDTPEGTKKLVCP